MQLPPLPDNESPAAADHSVEVEPTPDYWTEERLRNAEPVDIPEGPSARPHSSATPDAQSPDANGEADDC